MEKKNKILIVAGEASGDLHAANLVAAIQEISPGVSFFGLGGEKLKNQGVDLYFDLTELAVVGFFEVFKNLLKFRRIFFDLLEKIKQNKPDLAILVDYPGFNLRLAEELHKRNIPVIYYISPQIWAWGKNRIETIKKNVNKMLVLFAFEEELYRKHGVDVSWVGNPLLDTVRAGLSKKEFCSRFSLDVDKITVTLLPGSREKEVKTLLPIMLASAEIINAYLLGRVQFLVLASPTVKAEVFREIGAGYKLPLEIISNMTYDGIASSDFALVCSGTATLETAILAVPMAILYKVSILTWLFIRAMIKIPYIGLVNVVKGKKVVEEFIQFDAAPQRICDYVIPLLQDKNKLALKKLELLPIKNLLGTPGASKRAARIICDFLK